jgi:hypothetical protein
MSNRVVQNISMDNETVIFLKRTKPAKLNKTKLALKSFSLPNCSAIPLGTATLMPLRRLSWSFNSFTKVVITANNTTFTKNTQKIRGINALRWYTVIATVYPSLRYVKFKLRHGTKQIHEIVTKFEVRTRKLGAGYDPETIYNLRLILKIML